LKLDYYWCGQDFDRWILGRFAYFRYFRTRLNPNQRRTPSLKELAKSILMTEIQTGEHSSVSDVLYYRVEIARKGTLLLM
jgi:hypothetical protein